MTRVRWQANEMTLEHTGDRLHPIDTSHSGRVCGRREESEAGAIKSVDKPEAKTQETAPTEAGNPHDGRLQSASVVKSVASRLLVFIGRLLGALLFRLLARRQDNSAQSIERQAKSIGSATNSRPSTSVIYGNNDGSSNNNNNNNCNNNQKSKANQKPGHRTVVMAPTINLRGVVAGFEEQTVAKELSLQLVDEALAFVARIQQTSDMQRAEESEAREQHRLTNRRAMSEHHMQPPQANESTCSSPPKSLEQSDCSQNKPEFEEHQDKEERHRGEEHEEDEHEEEEEEEGEEAEELDDEDRISVSSSYEEFCGQQASEMNLRRLKMEALEDLVVCGQSREATESARRLFSCLTSDKHKQSTPVVRRQAGGDSLSSRSSGRGEELEDDDVEDEELMAALSRHKPFADHGNNNNNSEQIIEEIYSSGKQQDDYGTIKIARRKFCPSACSDCSAGSSSGRPHSASYGSTLICSLSPSRASQAGSEHASEQSPSPSDCYPIDGDEMRQCRAAFRENRRLIEQAQTLALKHMQEQALDGTNGEDRLSRCSSQATFLTDRSHWADSLRRRAQPPHCSHCNQKVYPLDRLELDFTRAKLNIHRNCFKCQVCHTLLRLETYASIDTKLFCPAHTKLATPVSTT